MYMHTYKLVMSALFKRWSDLGLEIMTRLGLETRDTVHWPARRLALIHENELFRQKLQPYHELT